MSVAISSNWRLPAQAAGARIERLREYMREHELDAFLITQPANRRYLSDFSGEDSPPTDTAGIVFVTLDRAVLVTDSRYDIQAREETSGVEVVTRRMATSTIGMTGELLREAGVKRLGFEAFHLIYAWYEDLREALQGAEFVPTRGLIDEHRRYKDDDELAVMRMAIAISDRAFDEVSAAIRPGMTEKEIARQIEARMVELGADAPAFPTMVASGPNGAMPHAVPGDRAVREGEPIVIDMGAQLHGYHSDMTRTIVLGEPEQRFKELYNIVLRAHLAGEEGARSGISGEAGDALCRDVIAAAGYGDNFGHGTGHGIGLEVHEGPQMRKNSRDAVLPDRAIVSVEPGIYIEGWGGVRIEDLVLLTPGGAEVLTRARKHGYYED